MKRRRRIYYADSQKALMWERWRKADGHCEQGLFHDSSASTVGGYCSLSGDLPDYLVVRNTTGPLAIFDTHQEHSLVDRPCRQRRRQRIDSATSFAWIRSTSSRVHRAVPGVETKEADAASA